MSLRNREQGDVTVAMCISAEGKVSDLRVAKSSGYDRLDKATLDMVKKLRFLPAMDSCGKPIDWCNPPYQLTMNWRLPGL